MTDDDFPKPCEVLVDGAWVPATLLRWYRWPNGTLRGAVTYRRLRLLEDLDGPVPTGAGGPFWFTYERSVPAERLRPATNNMPSRF